MTILPRVCIVTLLHDHKKILKSYRPIVANRRTNHSFTNPWRFRHRRARTSPSALCSSSSTASSTAIRRRRPRPFAACCRSLQQLSERNDPYLDEILTPINLTPPASPPRTPTTADRMARQERLGRTGPSQAAERHNHPSDHASSLQDNTSPFGSEASERTAFTPELSRASTTYGQIGRNPPNHSNNNNVFATPEFPRPSTASSVTDPMGPPSVDEVLTRSSRSTSSASRNTNRLSITLPIALPTSDPSRPLPSSAAASFVAPSVPGTPARQIPTAPPTPSDANEFIIAIAAQERRVMELREDLKTAEEELKRLKRQWTMHEACKKSGVGRTAPEPPRAVVPQPESWCGTPYDDDLAFRRSVELDRRKLLLQTQQQQQNTPGSGGSGIVGERKRVFQGRHARTLSLLSPTKPASDTFSVLDDADVCKSPGVERPPVVRRPSVLNKRASWQPQSHHQPSYSHHAAAAATGANLHGNAGAMSQIVEDFKLGFKTFYEDIRQITVGDEPVNGVAGATRTAGGADLPGRPAGHHHASAHANGGGNRGYADDQDTIRPSTTSGRPRLAAAFDYPSNDAAALETPSKPKASRASAGLAAARDSNARARNKHFSWTPLSFEGIDGEAWLNFDSPSSTGKSTRWSGSTMSGEESAEQPSTPAKVVGDVESPLTKKVNALGLVSPVSINPQRLEELTAQVVNRLSPSNIKRTATDYLNQWEQTLGEAVLENHAKTMPPGTASVATTTASEPKEDKENLLL